MLKYLRVTSQANNYKGKYALFHLEKCIVNVTANQMCKILFFYRTQSWQNVNED